MIPQANKSPDEDRAASEPVERASRGGASPIARVYFRREASEIQIKALREHLKTQASGPFTIEPHKGWTIVEVTTEADLLSLRHTFPRLIDGWQELI